MNTYQYVAKDKTGGPVTGTVDAASELEVVEILHKKDLIVVSVSTVKAKVVKTQSKGRVKLDDLVVFSRQLATMIDAGIPLAHALSILSEQVENPALRTVVSTVRQDIQGGMNFSDSLAKHPKVFSDFFISITRAGEASGMLDEVLDRMATYLEKSAAINRKVQSSLVYPAIVVSMAILITGFLIIKVVPTFKNIFQSLGGKLPTPTLILIGISDVMSKYLLIVIIFIAVVVVLFKKYIETEKGRYKFDYFLLRAPIFGPLLSKVALAKFSRTFSTLIKSGVPVLNALDIVAKTAGNKVIEEIILNCRKSVREGEPISKPLGQSPVFPPMVSRMIGVGEQTGQLEKMLSKIADFYDDQVDAAVSALTSAIEPLVIVFLGTVVGAIVISLFMPIFKITELINK